MLKSSTEAEEPRRQLHWCFQRTKRQHRKLISMNFYDEKAKKKPDASSSSSLYLTDYKS